MGSQAMALLWSRECPTTIHSARCLNAGINVRISGVAQCVFRWIIRTFSLIVDHSTFIISPKEMEERAERKKKRKNTNMETGQNTELPLDTSSNIDERETSSAKCNWLSGLLEVTFTNEAVYRPHTSSLA
jgi:hypothetical protein